MQISQSSFKFYRNLWLSDKKNQFCSGFKALNSEDSTNQCKILIPAITYDV